jgi:hypothetical protein
MLEVAELPASCFLPCTLAPTLQQASTANLDRLQAAFALKPTTLTPECCTTLTAAIQKHKDKMKAQHLLEESQGPTQATQPAAAAAVPPSRQDNNSSAGGGSSSKGNGQKILGILSHKVG